MYELDECYRISQDIKDVEDDIIELTARAMAAKNQIISDMPKGGGNPTSNIESYLIKKAKLERQKMRLQVQLENKWNDALKVFTYIGVNAPEVIALMKYRYYYGLQWKHCLIKMQDDYKNSNWTENKCFSTLRSILDKYNNKFL